jgi:hypothetical protein
VWVFLVFDRFDLVIETTPSDDSHSCSEGFDCLVVDGVDFEFFACVELPEEALISFDLDLIDFFVSTLGLEVIGTFVDVLFERSSVIDIEELHPFTYAEDGFTRFRDFLHRGEEIVIVSRDGISRSIHISTVVRWIDILASWEDEGITHLDKIICVRRKTGDDNGKISSLFDLCDVVKREIIKESPRVLASLCKDGDFLHTLDYKTRSMNYKIFFSL